MTELFDEIDIRLALLRAVKSVGTQRKWARLHRVRECNVSGVLQATRSPTPKMVDVLGFERLPTKYRKKTNKADTTAA